MRRVLLAELAIFFHVQFLLDLLLVARGVVIDVLANAAFELRDIFSCHILITFRITSEFHPNSHII